MAAISIALWENGYPILGVIQDLYHDQVFYSYKNKGSWLNNKNIKVSKVNNISEAILATGYPSGSNHETSYINKLVNNIQNYKKIRMLGSASLMLCYVANGNFDVYSENDIYIWDIAAGLSIINEAGGSFSIVQGTTTSKYNVKASNSILAGKL